MAKVWAAGVVAVAEDKLEWRLWGLPAEGLLSGVGVVLKLRSLSANLRIWLTVKGAYTTRTHELGSMNVSTVADSGGSIMTMHVQVTVDAIHYTVHKAYDHLG